MSKDRLKLMSIFAINDYMWLAICQSKNGMVLEVYYCRLSRASRSVYCTYSKMGVDACVPDSSCETLVLPVRNVLMSARISKLFGQTKVYHITQVALVSINI